MFIDLSPPNPTSPSSKKNSRQIMVLSHMRQKNTFSEVVGVCRGVGVRAIDLKKAKKR